MKQAKYCYQFILFSIITLNVSLVKSQDKGDSTRKLPVPKFLQLNYEEDYRYLAGKDSRTGLWEKLKYIPLYHNAYITLGGELRLRMETKDHLKYGKGNEDHGPDYQQRSRLWSDIRLLPSLRVFAELQSGTTTGLDFPPSVLDNNRIEVHQAFAEYSAVFNSGGKIFLRAGRQEILFGKARLFDIRQQPNNRRSFDAARIGFKKDKWNFGLIVGSEVTDKSGSFNDGTNEDVRFGAAHVSLPLGTRLPGSSLEMLYIYTDKETATNKHWVGERHTVSARVAGTEGALNYDAELIGQFGKTSAQCDVRACYMGAECYYTFNAACHPYIGTRIDIGSGDKDSTDQKDGSYDYLWSRGQSNVGDLGYTNIAAVGPIIGIKPTARLNVDLTVQGLWRMSREDGIYALSGAALRYAYDGTSRYVGVRSVLKAEYQLNPFISLGAYVNRTFKGSYLEQSAAHNSMLYASLYTMCRF